MASPHSAPTERQRVHLADLFGQLPESEKTEVRRTLGTPRTRAQYGGAIQFLTKLIERQPWNKEV